MISRMEKSGSPGDKSSTHSLAINTWSQSIIVLVFFLVIISGTLSFRAIRDAVEGARGQSIVHGEWAQAFEGNYTDGLAIQKFSQSLWGLIRYEVFREGARGVLIGDNGWLFTTEEYELPPTSEQRMEENADVIGSVQDQLRENGVELIVALVPAKARIYSGSAPVPLPAAAKGRYAIFREHLITRGIVAPDLSTPMNQEKDVAHVFLRTDTHWTPFGARVAALAIRDSIATLIRKSQLPTTESTLETEEPISITGDLVPFLSLGFFQGRVGPREEIVIPYIARMESTSALGLFDTPEIPVAVVGTSYSADPRWSFIESLKVSLQTDVLSVAERGEGPYSPLEAYLASDTFADIPPQLIIWEIPERYVDDPWLTMGEPLQ